MFDPGIYYISNGGFTRKIALLGCVLDCASDPTTKNGHARLRHGRPRHVQNGCDASGGLTVDTNSNDDCFGVTGVSSATPRLHPAAPYYGILFFEDRNAGLQTHTLGKGNGCFSIIGTIYITNTLAIMKANPTTQYQSVLYHGTPCTGVQNYRRNYRKSTNAKRNQRNQHGPVSEWLSQGSPGSAGE